MYYYKGISIPVETPESLPVIDIMELEKGKLVFIEIEFPDGCVGLVHCTVDYNAVQLVPWNKVGDLYGNNRTFLIPLNYMLNTPPYEIEIKAWNEDDTYPHTISVGAMVEGKLTSEPVAQVLPVS